jgi:hypothetical protein
MATLPARLQNVYWIGGGSGAGKSTIVRRLAATYGLSVYATDDVMLDHARRSAPEDAPELSRFMDMSMDERWVNRSPQTMFDTAVVPHAGRGRVRLAHSRASGCRSRRNARPRGYAAPGQRLPSGLSRSLNRVTGPGPDR